MASATLDLPSLEQWSTTEPAHALELYFEPLRELLGTDWLGYHNHCQRVLINVRTLAPDLELLPVVPALVFHDIGLWTHNTFDYIDPSAELARQHVEEIGRPDWVDPVDAMVQWHHKQRTYRGPHEEYVEPFRRGDMGDFTFGLQGGVPREALRDGRNRFPNAGFHRMLLRRTAVRLLTRPWSPAPMMRW